MRSFQRSHSELARHAREVLQELVKIVATLEIVDQCSERHTCTHEDRRAPEDPGIHMHNITNGHGYRIRPLLSV